MSSLKYLHDPSFGGGIHLPYGEFIYFVEVAIDNLLAARPEVARFSRRLYERDLWYIHGEFASILCLSSTQHRHYPLRQYFSWEKILAPNEDFGGFKANPLIPPFRVTAPDLLEGMRESHFIESCAMAFPSVAVTDYREDGQRRSVAELIAKSIFAFDVERFEEKMEADRPKRIFLSHKSVDKKFVREVAATLTALGFDPWLDEDAMKAGAKLERAIRAGFSDSCAAVFFVTPSFKDESFLESEVDYAIEEKRAKGDRFSIITLQLEGDGGAVGEIPKLLHPYVWKRVALSGVLRTIAEALPIRLGPPEWRV